MINQDFIMGYGAGKTAGGGGGGSGNIAVVEKNITANGDYTAPSGKAFSPVHVNVPATYPYPTYGTVKVVSKVSYEVQVTGYAIAQLPSGEYVFEPSPTPTRILHNHSEDFIFPVNQSGQQSGYLHVRAASVANMVFDDGGVNPIDRYVDSSNRAVIVRVENSENVENYTVTIQPSSP